MKKILYIGFVLAVFAACAKKIDDEVDYAPIVNYAVTNGNCKAPCAVLFTNSTRGGQNVQYIWEFGDGDTSTQANPRHFYGVGGDYNVKLTAKNKLGSNSLEKKVSIQSDLPLSFFDVCRVEKIKYLKVPPRKPDGSPWDDATDNQAAPELQWLVKDTNRVYIRGQELAELVNFDQKLLPFTVPRAIGGSLRQFTQYYELIVQDADDNSEDIMLRYKFRPIDYFPPQPEFALAPSNFTTEFTLKTPYGLEIIVTLSWQ